MTDDVSNWFLTQGPLGIATLLLIGLAIFLFRAREKDRGDYLAKIDDLQEKRIAEALKLQLVTEASNQKDDAMLATINSLLSTVRGGQK